MLEKTDDLMNNYELSSVTEPKREQFEKRPSTSGRRRPPAAPGRGGVRRGGCSDVFLPAISELKDRRDRGMPPIEELQVTNVVHPKLDMRISFVRSFFSVTLVLPPLDSETGWTGELWSNGVLLILEN